MAEELAGERGVGGTGFATGKGECKRLPRYRAGNVFREAAFEVTAISNTQYACNLPNQ